MKASISSSILFSISLLMVFPQSSYAHFGLILPSKIMVVNQQTPDIDILIAFCHPFEESGMDLDRPEAFGLFLHGRRYDLTKALQETIYLKHRAWKIRYSVKSPGDHIFFMIPAPYWEEMEGKYIQHITKVVVNGYGLEDSWKRPLGLPQEIVPLTRPYGLWTGNLFCGRVLFDGKAMADVDVEIEHLNRQGSRVIAPNALFKTQVIRTDQDGEFCYAIPARGWWGFSALTEQEKAMTHKGMRVPLERGAVIWVQAVNPAVRD